MTPVVPGLRLGPQHVQPRGRRGHDRLHRQRVLPGRPRRVHDQGRARSSSRRARRPTSASNGRRTTTPPTRPASRGCTAASTSRPTTSTGGHRLPVRQGGVGAGAAVLRRASGPAVNGAPGCARRRIVAVAAVARRRGGRPWWRSCAVAPARFVGADPDGALGAAALRRRDGRRRHRSRPTTATCRIRVGGGRRRVRLRRRRPARPVLRRRRAARRRSTATTSPIGGAAAVRRRSTTRRPTSTGVMGAYPLDIDGDGRSDLAVLRDRRERRCCAGSATAASSARTRRWGLDGGDAAHGRVQRHLGGLGRACRRSRSATTCDARRDRDPTTPCADNELIRPDAGRRPATAPPIAAARPAWCALSMLFSDWDRSGRRDLRISNDRHYYRPERRPGAALADRAGRAAAPVHAPTTAG